jgi:phosphonate transport system permease protein
MVGAGGIGVVLYEVISSFEYAHTSAVLLILIVSVTRIDMVSAWIRGRIL